MTNYTEEQSLFLGLKMKPEWLNWTEWGVLKFWYVPTAPCEPNRVTVLEKAKKWVRETTRYKSPEQAFKVAEESLQSGKLKVRQQLSQNKISEVVEPSELTTPAPWWLYD